MKKAKSLPRSRTLAEAQASYEVTSNPLYIWFAVWYCLANNKPLPSWVSECLLKIADSVINLTRRAEMSDEAKAIAVARSAGLAASWFKNFNRTEANKKASDALQIYKALGVIQKNKQAVYSAVIAGVGSERTIKSRLTVGRKIRDRQKEIGRKIR